MKKKVSDLLEQEKEKFLVSQDDLYKNMLTLLVSLLGENDPNDVLSRLVLSSMIVSNADGGSIYVLSDDELHFHTFYNNSLNLMGSVVDISKSNVKPLPLKNPETGEPNSHYISVRSALDKKIINIEDVYSSKGYDITGVQGFDKKNKYKTTSMLSVPLVSKGEVIGVGQLINSKKNKDGKTTSFSKEDIETVEILFKAAAPFIEMVNSMRDVKELMGTMSEVNAQGAWRGWLAEIRKEESK